MKNTTNYGIKKPDGTDVVDIGIINANMDVIDTQLKGQSQQIDDLSGKVQNIDISWNGIKDKPTTFPTTPHKHDKSEINNFPTSFPANGGNADTIGGYTAQQFLDLMAKAGDIMGKDYFYESIRAENISNITYTMLKSFTAAKGGYVEFGISCASDFNLKLVVDGVTRVSDICAWELSKTNSHARTDTPAVTVPIKFSFKNSFSISAIKTGGYSSTTLMLHMYLAN
ncbi:MAG: hypothetical protein AB9856_03855 [Cellulosilyticaceae bacterium]